jgi:hypothetical protein
MKSGCLFEYFMSAGDWGILAYQLTTGLGCRIIRHIIYTQLAMIAIQITLALPSVESLTRSKRFSASALSVIVQHHQTTSKVYKY